MPKAEAPASRKRSIILGEITSNPGQSGKQIAKKTGLSLHSIRQILLQLTKEELIEGFTKGREGYYLSGETL
ncbi:winged helix-turn-helix domain-containing protein [Microcoleus sp. herbarium12]